MTETEQESEQEQKEEKSEPKPETMCEVGLNVCVLTIVYDVDDYKRRGDFPTSDIYLFTSKKKCENKLRNIILDQIEERIVELEDDDIDRVPNVVMKYFVKKEEKKDLQIAEPDVVKGYSKWGFNSKLEENPNEEWIAEGEYVVKEKEEEEAEFAAWDVLKGYSDWKFNAKLEEIPFSEIEEWYEWIAAGEHVSYRWTYQIDYHSVY